MTSGQLREAEASLAGSSLMRNSPGRRTHLIPRLDMPRNVSMTEYVYEDLIPMTQSLRESWLSEQLATFENENKSYFYGEKEAYVENLYKYLKKVTKRWASWNHKSFGVMTSKDQIKELLQWEKSRGLRIHSGTSRNRGNSSSSEQDLGSANPLEKFESLCDCSQNLLRVFQRNIYKPLTDFFADNESLHVLQDIPRSLEKCLLKWENLLQTKEIDDRQFSKESEKEIFMNGLRNRTSEFDLVLRLVPDLFEKHLEALRLARRWRLIVKASVIKRRGTFTLPVPNAAKLLRRREEIQRRTKSRHTRSSIESGANSSDNELLDKQLDVAEDKYVKVLRELEDAKATCILYEDEISVYRKDYEKMKGDLDSMKDTCKDLHERISESRLNDLTVDEQISSSEEYCKVIKKELDHAKMKYCSQRIKLLNTKKRVENLNTQLTLSQLKYQKLEEDARETREKCVKLEEQLNISRRNLHTQGGMIDALQHQCKTLYDELEKSNGKCLSMEDELKESRKKCKVLSEDVERRRSREEELETENSYLRNIPKKSKDLDQSSVKKDCIFPDINRGRSS